MQNKDFLLIIDNKGVKLTAIKKAPEVEYGSARKK